MRMSRKRNINIAGQAVPESGVCNFLLDINVTLDVSTTVLEILTHKARKWLVFPTQLLFNAQLCPAKTRGTELPYGENCIILTSTVFSRPY